jgi:hypothetical protein
MRQALVEAIKVRLIESKRSAYHEHDMNLKEIAVVWGHRIAHLPVA